MKWPAEIIAYTDGASRGNPGPASIGIYITDADGEMIHEHREKLGHQTNNYAEYMAVLRALELAKEHGSKKVLLRADSELMVRQMTGIYKVKNEGIKVLFAQCKELAAKFELKIEHVRREKNKEADRLANLALDE